MLLLYFHSGRPMIIEIVGIFIRLVSNGQPFLFYINKDIQKQSEVNILILYKMLIIRYINHFTHHVILKNVHLYSK